MRKISIFNVSVQKENLSHIIKKKKYTRRESTLKHCPNCLATVFEEDTIHAEVICRACGLVIIAPPSSDYITEGYLIIRDYKEEGQDSGDS
jgi:ribosomal protein S27E